MKKKLFLTSAMVFILLVTAVVMTSCSFPGSGATGSQQSTIIPSTGTSYVVTDASSGGDSGALEGKNFSDQDFINVWYQWDVQASEKDISVGLVQFDISSLKNKDIKSAMLQMYVTSDTLSEPARLVDISLVTDKWDAKTVTFNNKPNWSATGIASSVVYGAGVWSSWDVSASVISAAKSGTVSYAAGLDTMVDKSQEQVMYASNNVAASAPRLQVTYASTNSGFPIWFWIVVIVVIAIIAFLAGWMITRRNSPKTAAAEATGVKPADDKKSNGKNDKDAADRKPSILDDKPSDNKPGEPPK
jgi:hypothetical protein